jgi:hypothetical protein
MPSIQSCRVDEQKTFVQSCPIAPQRKADALPNQCCKHTQKIADLLSRPKHNRQSKLDGSWKLAIPNPNGLSSYSIILPSR